MTFAGGRHSVRAKMCNERAFSMVCCSRFDYVRLGYAVYIHWCECSQPANGFCCTYKTRGGYTATMLVVAKKFKERLLGQMTGCISRSVENGNVNGTRAFAQIVRGRRERKEKKRLVLSFPHLLISMELVRF